MGACAYRCVRVCKKALSQPGKTPGSSFHHHSPTCTAHLVLCLSTPRGHCVAGVL